MNIEWGPGAVVCLVRVAMVLVLGMLGSERGNAATTGSARLTTAPSHRVMSCNILLDLPEQRSTHSWEMRRPVCEEILRRMSPDVIGFQEMNPEMKAQLEKSLAEYDTFGLESPDIDAGPERFHGIRNVIFYKRERYRLVSGGCYWLSETPHLAGSKGFGEALARHANWVRLEDRATGRQFRVLNTHLAAHVALARVEEAKILAEETSRYAEDFPQILTGDFNSDVAKPVLPRFMEAGWRDTYAAVHGVTEPGHTGHGLEGPAFAPKARNGKIDFVFTRGKVQAVGASVVRDEVDGVYPSDHYFVSADVVLP